MLFNSAEFLLFFPVVTLLYFLVPHAFRWPLLLTASCLFYMAFIPAYILVLFALIGIDYTAALLIERSNGRERSLFLLASIISTCLVLFVFKYFNFLSETVRGFAHFFGLNYPATMLNLILPVGLSFHTFQSLSYVIEVYRKNQKAEHHLGIYALYVMFYPQMVAGPIERPQNLLHQFYEKHSFEYFRVADGLKRMALGMLKKVVIADRVALFVVPVYSAPREYGGGALILATVFFAFQIYCDFSGYSDIAIGAARVMGFRLMNNFDRPYSARSIQEFWRRWHISLSSWFRDYLYIPLGGNRVLPARWLFNVFITFLVSGLWHGANWTYVVWGAVHGLYIIIGKITSSARNSLLRSLGLRRQGSLLHAGKVFLTFALVCCAWVFFRAANISDAFFVLKRFFSLSSWGVAWPYSGRNSVELLAAASLVALLLVIDRAVGSAGSGSLLSRQPRFIRWLVYYSVVLGILLLGVFKNSPFIYFQF